MRCRRRCSCLLEYFRVREELLKGIFYLFAVTYCLILPLMLHGARNSLYFLKPYNLDPARNELKLSNTRRLFSANAALQNYFHSYPTYNYVTARNGNGSSNDIELGIVTANRAEVAGASGNPHYLTQSVATFLQLLRSANNLTGFRLKLGLFICNVDSEPSRYIEALNISTYIPTVTKYAEQSVPNYDSTLKKERVDYAYCLIEGVRQGGRYVMLVEDDALPHSDFLQVLQHAIVHRIENGLSREQLRGRIEDLAYVKFYHPLRLNNYAGREPQRWSEWVGISAILASLSMLVATRYWHPAAKFPVQVWLYMFAYFMLMLLVIGRTNILELRRLFSPHLYSFGQAPSCCTPAMLFPRDMALKIADYMLQPNIESKVAKDVVLDNFLVEERLRAFIVEPNTFTHIGMISTLRGKEKALLDPFIV